MSFLSSLFKDCKYQKLGLLALLGAVILAEFQTYAAVGCVVLMTVLWLIAVYKGEFKTSQE